MIARTSALEDNPSPLPMHRIPKRLSISPVVEAPQMKKIVANIQFGPLPAVTLRDLRRPTAKLSGGVRPSPAWRTRTTAKVATSVAAAPALRMKRQPSASVALDARKRPAAEPRNWVDVKRPKAVPQ